MTTEASQCCTRTVSVAMMVPRTSARAANAKEKRHGRTGSRQSAQPGAVVHASGVVSTSPHQHGLLAVDCSLRYVSRAEGPVSCFVVIRSRGGRVKLRRYLCSRREEAQPMRVGLRVIGPASTEQFAESCIDACCTSPASVELPPKSPPSSASCPLASHMRPEPPSRYRARR